jgi:folylpolyglutamate synthase/dihydropteroate synthase
MTNVVDHWIVVDLNVARAEKAANIERILYEIYAVDQQKEAARETRPQNIRQRAVQNTLQQTGYSLKIEQAQSVTDGCRIALATADEPDRIVIFGSFITVAQALRHAL